MTLFLLSFIAGVLTILAPCILPLLPVVIGGAASDSRSFRKPITIIVSLAVSVIVFTLLLKVSTLFIDILPSTWTYLSGGILVVLGVILVFPNLWDRLPIPARISRRSHQVLASGSKQDSFLGDVLMGAALGPIFSTCSPTYFVILATVLPVSVAQGLLYLLVYVLGLSLMLLLVAVLGQKIVAQLGGAADSRGYVKRGVGVLVIVVGLAILTGYDKVLETSVLNSGFFDVTQIEIQLLDRAGIE